MRLWIDTDVGDDPDDAVALLCAAAHPSVELVGVSTVDGHHARRVRAATALIDAPVHAGDDPHLGEAVAGAAPDALLAIGPLTNVAALAGSGVPLPPVTLMGGALGEVRHWGVELRVEHNFSRDPSAAAAVLQACAPVLMVPLDVTVTMRLAEPQLGRLLDAAPQMEPAIRAWLDAQRDLGVTPEERAVVLHDPLALLALLDPTLVRVEERLVSVAPDGRVVDTTSGSAARIVRDVQAPRGVEAILGLVARGMG